MRRRSRQIFALGHVGEQPDLARLHPMESRVIALDVGLSIVLKKAKGPSRAIASSAAMLRAGTPSPSPIACAIAQVLLLKQTEADKLDGAG